LRSFQPEQAKFLSTPLKRKLANLAATIPFMVTDGIGLRNVHATAGSTDLSGSYLLVEQTMVKNWTAWGKLYFMDNPFVIQSEVIVLCNCSSDGDGRHNNDNLQGRTKSSVDK
jgi:hypothetical protein